MGVGGQTNLYVSKTLFLWLHVNKELFEKHGSKCAWSCIGGGKHVVYFIHAEKLPCSFLSLLCFFTCSFLREWHTCVDCEGNILSVRP